MGSFPERKDEGVWRLRTILRPDEAQSCDQLVWWAVLATVLLRAGYSKYRLHCSRFQQRWALLRGPEFLQPGKFPGWHACGADLPREPKFPHLPDHLPDLLPNRRGRCSGAETLQTARAHFGRRLPANADAGFRGSL